MSPPDKKHPCPDCRQCQWCGDDRCRLCLKSAGGCRRKLSMAEQIALYEQLNAGGQGLAQDAAGHPCAKAAEPPPFDLENSADTIK